MNNLRWVEFFDICNETLGKGSYSQYISENWCSWITFDRICRDTGYWQSGIPNKNEYDERGVKDGGTWGQPFEFESIAHLIIPSRFIFMGMINGEFINKDTKQDILKLSNKLRTRNINHVISDWSLELRLIN